MVVLLDTLLRSVWQEAADAGTYGSGNDEYDTEFLFSPLAIQTVLGDIPIDSMIYGHPVRVDPELKGIVMRIQRKEAE